MNHNVLIRHIQEQVNMHPEFDLEFFRETLDPCDTYASERSPIGDSACAIVAYEHFRQIARESGADLGPSCPTDKFVMGLGEAPHRYLTKVNGLPYRPRDRPWPLDEEGRPYIFLLQYCFADSRDLVGELPGDVLLVFVRPWWSAFIGGIMPKTPMRKGDLLFEWYPLGLSDLVTNPLPAPYLFPTGYGVRHRSCDYTDEARAIDVMRRFVPDSSLPDDEFREVTLRSLVCWPPLKIGGAPFWWNEPQGDSPGIFLGGFDEIGMVPGEPYPWVNHPDPYPIQKQLDNETYFKFEMIESLNFFLRDDGEVQWIAEYE
jgi:hypothetical protein